jgi:hypothetical protein
MASAELRRRVEKVVGYPPLSEMSALQRREFHEALLDDADSFEDLPGKWQAAIPQRRAERAEAAPPAGVGSRSPSAPSGLCAGRRASKGFLSVSDEP